MKDPFDCILLFLTALVIWCFFLAGPPVKAEETKSYPRIHLESKDNYISYCYARAYGFYLPCMYSKKVHKA